MAAGHNAITDIEGIAVGHFTAEADATGITVVLCADGAVAGVDVRGAAPGTRETDLLAPANLVQEVQAVALTGGSVFGLAAVDGVVRWLAERGKGFPVGGGKAAPIVPAAVLFDLGRGLSYPPPVTPDWGYEACERAHGGAIPMGCVGAGTGAVAGSLKGGVGTASEHLPSGVVVGALATVNAFGHTVNPATGRFWEAGLEKDGEFGATARRAVRLPAELPAGPGQNTTIGVVATDARLTKSEALKIAQMAHDGLARAIRPAHTLFDGDTIFCLATCRKDLPETLAFVAAPHAPALNDLGRAAADTFARAVVHAMVAAKGLYGFTAFRELDEREGILTE
jgi:L-aminopeptidase/D-esterase-like protein